MQSFILCLAIIIPLSPTIKKKKTLLHRYFCPDDRELDAILVGTPVNCVLGVHNLSNSSNPSRVDEAK